MNTYSPSATETVANPSMGAVVDQLEAAVADCKAAWANFTVGPALGVQSNNATPVPADRIRRLHDLIFELRGLAESIQGRA